MIVCFLGYLLAVSVFFTTFVHKIYVVLKMEKVYAHREFGLEANIIGCATYDGILLCTRKGKKMVEYALAGMDNQLFVSTYMLQLPDKGTLEKFLLDEIKNNS